MRIPPPPPWLPRAFAEDEMTACIAGRIAWCWWSQMAGVLCMFLGLILWRSVGLWALIPICLSVFLMIAPLFYLEAISRRMMLHSQHFARERRSRMIAMAVMGPVGILVLPLSIMLPWSWFGWWKFAITGASVMLLLSAAGFWLWSTERSRSAARKRDYLICPKCRYDLRHLASEGECPECGEQYRYEDLPRIWREGLGPPRHFTPEQELHMLLNTEVSPEENQRFVAKDDTAQL